MKPSDLGVKLFVENSFAISLHGLSLLFLIISDANQPLRFGLFFAHSVEQLYLICFEYLEFELIPSIASHGIFGTFYSFLCAEQPPLEVASAEGLCP